MPDEDKRARWRQAKLERERRSRSKDWLKEFNAVEAKPLREVHIGKLADVVDELVDRLDGVEERLTDLEERIKAPDG